eukprot:scpid42725/ scgid15859/ 
MTDRKRWRFGLALKICVSVVAIPALLALIGLAAEAAIYKPGRRPGYHLLHFALAGWIAAPLILVRWCWPWPKHRGKLDLLVYVLQTVGFVLALKATIITGNDIYQSNAFLRKDFNSEQFTQISSEDDVWSWLRSVMKYVYDRDVDSTTVISRRLSGRMAMVTSIRLRQNRVKPINCSALYTSLAVAGSGQCYPSFSMDTEDRSTYGAKEDLQFKYYKNPVNSTTGYEISMEDYQIAGDFGEYPLAGFWVWFSPPVYYNRSLHLLQLMRDGKWIDDQTRAIGLDVGIALLDFVDNPIWTNLDFLIEKNRAGRYVAMQPRVDINYYFQEDDLDTRSPENEYDEYISRLVNEANLNTLDNCTIVKFKSALQPLYLGTLPFVTYTVVALVFDVIQNYRRLINKPFIVPEIAWAVFMAVAIGLKMKSIRYADCGNSVFDQTLFTAAVPLGTWESATVRYAVRFEVLQLAAAWTRVRLLLGIAILIHTFNFLKFLLHLKALGVLVRTLRFAVVELLSFSFSFLILFAGFVAMFFCIYSIEASDFRTIVRSVTTLWLGMIGELNITPELWRSGIVTVAIFLVFTFLSSFVLLTLIVSIISKAHEEARDTKAAMLEPLTEPASGDNQEDDVQNAKLVGEVDVMLDTLNTWKAYMEKQQRRRKIGPINDSESCASSVKERRPRAKGIGVGPRSPIMNEQAPTQPYETHVVEDTQSSSSTVHDSCPAVNGD